MKKSKPSDLPSVSGVYLFKNALHQIIYVGKAKSLKKRVASYFSKQGTDWKIDALLEEHVAIDHIATHTETEALLLEAQLISEHKPKYNVLLKSGQPFVYILFTKELLPQITIVRNKKQKGIYFGPFMHKKQARAAYEYIMRTFKLSWCNKKMEGGCLKFHLDLCAGNCTSDFDTDAYLFRVQLAINLLQGKYKQSLKALENKITEYTQELAFEKAQRLHYYLQNLETVFNTLKTRFSETKYEKEVFLATVPIWRQKEADPTLSSQLQAFLGIDKPIHTIDCFDISHFQSTEIVGSCIRFLQGIPDKNNFRRFKIRSIKEQNDYAALQEIVIRRYKNPNEIPDLILIDGGKGQLEAVRKVLPETAYCISLAKREETIFRPGDKDGIKINLSSKTGKLLIALRDYAHHFAITYHRKRRSKTIR